MKREVNVQLENLVSSINIDELLRYKTEYNLPETDGRLKYFNYRYEFEKKLMVFKELELDKSGKRSILDISGGMGYFSYICRMHNHDVVLTDIDNELYDTVRKNIFGIVKTRFIYPNRNCATKLPETIGQFDVVCAISVEPMSFWEESTWKDFLSDAMEHLNKSGIIYVRPNRSFGLNNLLNICKNYETLVSCDNSHAVFRKP